MLDQYIQMLINPRSVHRRGKSGGLNEAQIDSLLVDFDKREGESSEAGSEVDESLTIPKKPFQRTRSASEESEVNLSFLSPDRSLELTRESLSC